MSLASGCKSFLLINEEQPFCIFITLSSVSTFVGPSASMDTPVGMSADWIQISLWYTCFGSAETIVCCVLFLRGAIRIAPFRLPAVNAAVLADCI
jgi:hypothetical protein